MKKLIALLGLGILLTGCGGKKEAATAEKKDGKVVLRVATWETVSKYYKDLIAEYEKLNPNVTIQPIEATVNDYPTKVATMLASGDDFDVVTVKELSHYVSYSKNGYVLDLTDKVNNDIKDKTPYGDLFPNIEVSFMKNGVYMIPYRKDIYVLYYNKDLYDKGELKYPDSMTWNQFRENSKAIKDKTGVNGTYLHPWTSQVINWPISQGKGKVDGKDFQFMSDSYKFFQEMQNVDKSMMTFNAAKSASAHYSGEFSSGRAGQILMGTWFIQTMINDINTGKSNVKWGIAPIPHNSGESENASAISVTGLAINRKSKNQDEAWKFIKWMSEKDAAMIQAKNGSFPAYMDKEVLETYMAVPGFPKDAVSAKALVPEKTALEIPPTEFAAEIAKAMNETHVLIMSENISLEEGLKEMLDRSKEIMK